MRSKRIALCGLLVALAVVMLLLGGVLLIATFAAPMLAMIVLLPIQEEYGSRFALTAYAATSILALLLVADRELAMIYVFFGWYPVLRPHLARLPGKLFPPLCKAAIYSAATLTLYGLLLRLMGLTSDLLEATWIMNFIMFLVGGAVFFLTDKVLARMTVLWHRKLRRRFFR